MIVLAIESSNSRGMGHLFRSLLFVQFFSERQIDYVYLINNDKSSLELLTKQKIEYEVVDYNDQDSLWEQDIIKKYNVDIWLNDKFETTKAMAEHIKQSDVFLAMLDDIGLGEMFADIHYVGLISFSKKKFYAKNVLIGMEYLPLNSEIERYRHLRKRVNRIIVSFGGSDPHNNSISVVKELLKYDYKFDVTVGPNFLYEEELMQIKGERFSVYKNVNSLIELFSNYDLAITGGGVTCCEANAAGLPCIIIANAPHEVNTGINMEKFGGCIYAGSYENWNKENIKNICEIDIEQMSKSGMEVFCTDAVNRIYDDLKNRYVVWNAEKRNNKSKE